MGSLNAILAIKPSIIYPGHGPVITDPEKKIKEYIEHRLQRERQILDCLPEADAGYKSISGIVEEIYKETPAHLHAAAARNVEHHLNKLIKDGKVVKRATDNSYGRNPSLCDIYTEHSQMTTVAKYSPSGFYIASADQTGKIRIWDTVQKEHILKNEFQPFVGIVKDLAWSPDSQRIMAVGEGRERFGHVFMAETGTSVGEIGGHSKQINSCDFRPTRPFRIITGSEDNTVGIYEGPPFKYKLTISDHARFVQSVRFSPNGELFASGGFDGKMFLYNASTYEKVGEFGSPAHSGGIYAVSWSPDNTKILTASGDKTCKIWDASTLSVVTEFVMGADVMDQQVSCLWQGDYLLSVSLSGFINYLDVNNPEKPRRVVKGHHKSITALAVSPNRETIYTGSHDGLVVFLDNGTCFWDAASGDQDRVSGNCHSNQVQDMCTGTDSIYTCGLDDTVRSINLMSNQYSNLCVKMDSQPRGMGTADGNLVIVADICEIIRDTPEFLPFLRLVQLS
ncbi:hypothetical protein HPB51_023363 [Rhipicephalus microplus]|uniref:LACTB2 winged helix domain-containing protein n=1 Tax=Rhipicephalus microplus TaxID=6941 RepID=A0A9J6DCW0_RHIMP|nr:hypothetical protein HPB51_023363 [Rhipicephalus microplus]